MILDTNALSALAENDHDLLKQIELIDVLFLPVIVLGEYRFGVSQSKYKREYERWLDSFVPTTTVIPIGESTSLQYARICRELKRSGTPIPTNDVWIAALAVEHNVPIVSRDTHFGSIRNVRLVTW